MAVGLPLKTTYADGDVYSASDVNDTNGTINLFQTSTLSSQAGKNAVINGGMDIWQRGTSSTFTGYSTADRWWIYSSAGTTTSARESTIVPAGFNYSLKLTQASSAAVIVANQAIETSNALAYAGKNVALSAYVSASASCTLVIDVEYSTSVDNAVGGSWTATTLVSGTATATVSSTASFTRISGVYSIPSTAKSLRVRVYTLSLTVGTSCYISGVQMELGTNVTTFSRAGGTIQGELAACQRYYEIGRVGMVPSNVTANDTIGTWLNFAVLKRTSPTLTITIDFQAGFTSTTTAGDQTSNGMIAKCVKNGSTGGGYWFSNFTASAEL
jgi:hypothetical protein